MRNFAKLGLLAVVAAVGAACQAESSTIAKETGYQTGCTIETRSSAGALMLTGIAKGTEGETGQYRLTLRGGDGRNSTNTSQGGAFQIGPGGEAQTGTVRLFNTGVYDADLEISLAGKTHSCSKRIGNSI
ncbi:curli-like amyloid fiber formation chaperone CsgH [Roseibium sediminicola]|uniref:CsgH-like domain-containing protein n=1 Tax=Roseibium sediminicola TaxID=2933272 RepID=A0ABT0H2D5_9HYPH|nr:curli-like amyloid fiber formation chaperone CsgH [Roseibium sp. CAU 1639]MCK7615826.1 hypothetical protein [Roseibium sp. CAU 1639]